MRCRFTNLTRPLRRTRRMRGWTLVEILVAVSIIFLLLSLVLAGGRHWRENSRATQARMMLHSLSAIVTDYETVMNGERINADGAGAINWSTAKARNAPGATGSAVITDSIERFVWAVRGLDDTATSLEEAGREFYGDIDGNGFLDIVDPWKTKIRYISSPEVRFESAGPDGDFDATADNISSLDIY